ncbi:hypothetical protein V6N13_038467 [Hibiscus sabdariffa]
MHRLSKQYLAINQMMDCVVLREFHSGVGYLFTNIALDLRRKLQGSNQILYCDWQILSFLLTAQDWQVLVALASHAGAAAAATILVELAEKLNTAAQIL